MQQLAPNLVWLRSFEERLVYERPGWNRMQSSACRVATTPAAEHASAAGVMWLATRCAASRASFATHRPSKKNSGFDFFSTLGLKLLTSHLHRFIHPTRDGHMTLNLSHSREGVSIPSSTDWNSYEPISKSHARTSHLPPHVDAREKMTPFWLKYEFLECFPSHISISFAGKKQEEMHKTWTQQWTSHPQLFSYSSSLITKREKN